MDHIAGSSQALQTLFGEPSVGVLREGLQTNHSLDDHLIKSSGIERDSQVDATFLKEAYQFLYDSLFKDNTPYTRNARLLRALEVQMVRSVIGREEVPHFNFAEQRATLSDQHYQQGLQRVYEKGHDFDFLGARELALGKYAQLGFVNKGPLWKYKMIQI